MTIYVVQNNDDIVLAIFRKKKKAKAFAKNIGKKRWNENWTIEKRDTNDIEPWILAGSEEYRARKRRVDVR